MRCLRILVLVLSVVMLTSWGQSAWAETVSFSPQDLTYVDRSEPKGNVGYNNSNILKIGDEMDPTAEGGYYSYMYPTRTYMWFDVAPFQSQFSSIDNVTLKMVLFNKNTANGTIGTRDIVNVRQITALDTGNWTASNFMDDLSWDSQAERGIKFGNIFASANVNASILNTTKIWSGNLTGLVNGWVDNSIANYGIILEADFDGAWSEINPTKYSVGNASQMNELEAIFLRSGVTLDVTGTKVVPEPVSLLLFGLGGAAMALVKRKRKA